jgi:hypothetical protein
MSQKDANSGVGVDFHGGPVIDPTKNVLSLVEAAVKRTDDIANARVEYERICRALESKRLDDLRAAESRRVDELLKLRAEFSDQLSAAESKRIDAIRAVDVTAVNTAADRASAAITALAATTASNAENLRNALNATATTIATQTANTVSAITERISALEKSSYEGKGKQAVADPMLAELVQEMKSLREARSQTTGKSEGIGLSWGVIVVVVGGIIALIGAMAAVALFFGHPSGTASAPQVIYVPATAAQTATPK